MVLEGIVIAAGLEVKENIRKIFKIIYFNNSE